MLNQANDNENVTMFMENNKFILINDEQYNEAKFLVKLLSRDRGSNYHQWIEVGQCLHNIDDRLLGDWIDFSRRTRRNDFDKADCEKRWKKLKQSNYAITTLHNFALKDNPERYLEMKEDKITKLMREGFEISHSVFANLLIEKCKFSYRCASIKHNIWYQFKSHKWVEIDSAYTLRKLIADCLVLEYSKLQTELYETSKVKQGYDKEQCICEAVMITKVVKNLNNSTFKNGIMRECADLTYDPHFLSNLDENTNLICFEDGVYDIEKNIFRNGLPDDCISLSTGYNFMPYDKENPVSLDIKNFFKQIQPNKIMRQYLLTVLSTCLSGGFASENFYIFTSPHSSGKTTLLELMKYTLGGLYKMMDFAILTDKYKPTSIPTVLSETKGIRMCVFECPSTINNINIDFMKIFTGDDWILAGEFKEKTYFKPQFVPFLECGHLPTIKTDDNDSWRKTKVIQFPNKLVSPARANNETILGKNQLLVDHSLSKKISTWKQMFMALLIHYYRKYKLNGLSTPKLVIRSTSEYRNKCDIYYDFISNYLIKTGNAKDIITISDFRVAMKSWYNEKYANGKCPSTKNIRDYLSRKMPTYKQNKDLLTNYKLKSMDDDSESQ